MAGALQTEIIRKGGARMAGGRWALLSPDPEKVGAMTAGGYPRVLAGLLVNRGVTTPEQAEKFLSCAGELHNPALMKGIDAAAGRIRSAVGQGERIAVYGDYDVDGVTATALLVVYLRGQGADVRCYLPDREREGYGLNAAALDLLKKDGVSLVVTVDTGISALPEAAYAREIGLDLVITDHHEPRGELPLACAVVDPKQPGCGYPFRELAGVGVAFKLACVIGSEDQERLFERFGDLVCLGTVADVVPLVDENRLIASRGLALMAQRGNLGLRALLEAAGVGPGKVTAERLSFGAAPRVNAAGRMGTAMDALRLLTTEDESEARALAGRLDALNRRRQEIEAQIFAEASLSAAEEEGPVLMVRGEGWHDGVIGIVASKLAETFRKPAIVVSFRDGIGRASCRSFPGFNIHDALLRCAELLDHFGGHALAAGFTVREENYGALKASLEAYAGALPRMPEPMLTLEFPLGAEEITLETARLCEKLEPCGAGNPAPLFLIGDARVERVTPLKAGKHLRLSLSKGNRRFQAIFFNADRRAAGSLIAGLEPGDLVDLAACLSVNEYGGAQELSVIVRDIAAPSSLAEQEKRYRALVARRGAIACDRLPDRRDFAAVYRYLEAQGGNIRLDRACGAVKQSVPGFTFLKLLIILDVFEEMKLVAASRDGDCLSCRINRGVRISLGDSRLLQALGREENAGAESRGEDTSAGIG